MTINSKLAMMVAAMAMTGVTPEMIGVDLASQPDRTAYWPHQPKSPDPKKRAKVKAARKQRKAKP